MRTGSASRASGARLFDHPALAERFEFAEDAKSATFWLRPGIKFHDGSPITPADVKYSYEHYRGGWADVLHKMTESITIVDDRAVRFQFKGPFLDFATLLGTGNVSGAGWVVPEKYYEKVGQNGYLQKPIGAGPYKLVAQQPGNKLESEAFASPPAPSRISQVSSAVPGCPGNGVRSPRLRARDRRFYV